MSTQYYQTYNLFLNGHISLLDSHVCYLWSKLHVPDSCNTTNKVSLCIAIFASVVIRSYLLGNILTWKNTLSWCG